MTRTDKLMLTGVAIILVSIALRSTLVPSPWMLVPASVGFVLGVIIAPMAASSRERS